MSMKLLVKGPGWSGAYRMLKTANWGNWSDFNRVAFWAYNDLSALNFCDLCPVNYQCFKQVIHSDANMRQRRKNYSKVPSLRSGVYFCS